MALTFVKKKPAGDPPPSIALQAVTASKASVPVGQGGAQVQEAAPPQPVQQALVEQTQESVEHLQALVDKYTSMQEELDAQDVLPLLKRYDDAKKELQLIAKGDEYPSDHPVVLQGTHGNYVEFSPCSDAWTVIDQPGLIAKLGQATWNEISTVTLGNLRKLLSENELKPFLDKGLGARSQKAIVKG